MAEQKEDINVTKNDDSTFKIVRTITETVSEEELLKVYSEINKGCAETQKQIDDIPAAVAERTKLLTNQKTVLDKRLAAFKEIAEPIVAAQKAAEETKAEEAKKEDENKVEVVAA